MGDRCFFAITLLIKDLEQADNVTGGNYGFVKDYNTANDSHANPTRYNVPLTYFHVWEEINILDEVTVEFVHYEINYGGSSLLEQLTANNIPYSGHHGAGEEYGPMVFVCVGYHSEEVNVDMDGQFYVPVDHITLKPDEYYMRLLRRYVSLVNKWDAMTYELRRKHPDFKPEIRKETRYAKRKLKFEDFAKVKQQLARRAIQTATSNQSPVPCWAQPWASRAGR
jgi:hypothetical protein